MLAAFAQTNTHTKQRETRTSRTEGSSPREGPQWARAGQAQRGQPDRAGHQVEHHGRQAKHVGQESALLRLGW